MPDSKPRPSRGPFEPTIILHGGAGSITRSNLPSSLYRQYYQSLLTYLVSACTLLNDSVSPASALDAATHAVSLMEDDPLFNCGRGSVFNLDGEIEMEASIAVSSIAHPDHSRDHQQCWQHKSGAAKNSTSSPGSINRSAAVSLIRNTRHPIRLAREVLLMADKDNGLGGTAEMHGHLSGREIEEWGWEKKELEKKPDRWFWTRRRWEEHRRGLGKDAGPVRKGCDNDQQEKRMTVIEVGETHDIEGKASRAAADDMSDLECLPDSVFLELPSQGTVGCVCMDSWGNLAVATSTGGLTNKRPGRIGDTPTVGAGFWAESWYEAISESSTLQVTTRAEDILQTSMSQIQNGINRFLQQSWIAQCLIPTEQPHSSRDSDQEELLKADIPPESKSLLYQTKGHTKQTQRRAVAMSGTGNGDSFLRTNAARTTAATCRFARWPLSEAVTAVSGPNGELQQSAGDRWNKTGEGQGGIIAIEATESEGKHTSQVVFDFNCGGMWRAWYDDGKPRVMVFRDEY